MPALRISRGRSIFWVVGLLLFVLLLLVAYQALFANRLRFIPDPDLMQELADVVFVEDDLAPLSGQDWPQWRGPRRDGITTDPNLRLSLSREGLRKAWEIDGGDGYSSFSVKAGTIISMINSSGKECVLCWNTDGSERWRHSHTPASAFDYGGPRATPTIDGDFIYTTTSDGEVLCLTADAGKVEWRVPLKATFGGSAPKWGFAASPLVDEDRVYLPTGGSSGNALAALDKRTGKTVWTSQDDPPGYSSPIAVTIGGVRQVIFFTGKRLLGVEREKGRLLWDFAFADRFEVNAATPIAIRAKSGGKEIDYIFISSGYEKGCAFVRVFADGGGKFRVKAAYESNELCCHFASPVRRGEQVYGLDEKRDLTCLDLRTGEVKWRMQDTGGRKVRGFKKGSLIRVDENLLVLGEEGHLALIEATPEGYREKGVMRPFRDRCWTTPVLANGKIYLRDQAKVLCLEAH